MGSVRRHAGAVALVLAVSVLASCRPLYPPGFDSADGTATAAMKPPARCRVSGSAIAMSLVRLLADDRPDPDVSFEFLPAMRSSGGVSGVAAGSIEMGAMTRDVEPSETAGARLRAVVLADDGLVVAVNPSVRITGLSSAEVRDIYLGRYRDWSELGGPKMPIRVMDRGETEGGKIVFRRFVLGPVSRSRVTSAAMTLRDEVDLIDAVRTTPGGIGYFSLGYGVSRRARVRMLALDGVQPTVDNILSGRYRMTRPLVVVTRADADPAIREFLRWATGPEAGAVMKENGYAPARH